MPFTVPPFEAAARTCRVMGHEWEIVWSTANLKHSLAMVVCANCDEVGWLA